jgi:lipoprotein NlpD
VNFVWKYSICIFLATCCIAGCGKQAPAKVVVAQPTIKRLPVKSTAKVHTKTVLNNNSKLAKRSEQTVSKQHNNSIQTATKLKPLENTLTWRWPTKGSILTSFSSPQATFKGIDIAGSEGTPILAACDGEVVYSGNSLRGYGNLIIIKHQKNFLSAYAHNRKNMVKEGDKVKIGQRIAEMGQTGTDKVKLHFEVRYQGKPVDPQAILPAN